MPNSQICVPQLLHFCFTNKYVRWEKLNKPSTTIASLVRNSLPQHSEQPEFSYAAKPGSHSWSTAIKYNRELSLKEHQNLFSYNERAAFNNWVGRCDVYQTAHANQTTVLTELCPHTRVTCSYTCIWDQWWTQALIMQIFQLPPFCKQLSIMVYIPLQGVICNVFFSFSGIFNSRTQIIPP